MVGYSGCFWFVRGGSINLIHLRSNIKGKATSPAKPIPSKQFYPVIQVESPILSKVNGTPRLFLNPPPDSLRSGSWIPMETSQMSPVRRRKLALNLLRSRRNGRVDGCGRLLVLGSGVEISILLRRINRGLR